MGIKIDHNKDPYETTSGFPWEDLWPLFFGGLRRDLWGCFGPFLESRFRVPKDVVSSSPRAPSGAESNGCLVAKMGTEQPKL